MLSRWKDIAFSGGETETLDAWVGLLILVLVLGGARHPFMHRTDSVDYSVVLTGEIYMMMDEEEYLLKAGDTVIQQGTNHAWSNRGTEPCLIAFMLNDVVAD